MKNFLEYSKENIKSIQEVLTLDDVDSTVAQTVQDFQDFWANLKQDFRDMEDKFNTDSDEYDEDEHDKYLEEADPDDKKTKETIETNDNIKSSKDLDNMLEKCHTKNSDGFPDIEQYLKDNPDTKNIGKEPYYPNWGCQVFKSDKLTELYSVFGYTDKFEDGKLPDDSLYLFNLSMLKGYGQKYADNLVNKIADIAKSKDKSKVLLKLSELGKNVDTNIKDRRTSLIEMLGKTKPSFSLKEGSNEIYEMILGDK